MDGNLRGKTFNIPGEPLAKSSDKSVPLSLHLSQVRKYTESLVDAYYTHWHRILGEENAKQLSHALIIAALFHDLGKATEGFQRALKDKKYQWEYRHEVLSLALLLTCYDNEIDDVIELAASAVLTHHRDLQDPKLLQDCGWVILPEQETIAKKRFRQKAKEMLAYWDWLKTLWKNHAELCSQPLPNNPELLEIPLYFVERLKRKLSDFNTFMETNSMPFVLVRGCLMVADHAVSAGVVDFLVDLPSPSLPPLRSFQLHLGQHRGDAFLEAPTGSGKTIAALRWALRNRLKGERIFYLLPYQASIEAMANTLKEKFREENVAVLHARALDYAFRDYFEGTGEYEVAIAEAHEEVEVNRLVHKPIKVATPFQLLKWLFGIPRFEIGISEMVGGLFIFDEIHAYDPHTVALITEMIRVLRKLNGRFLFMSATFPPFLKELLKEAVGSGIVEFQLRSRKTSDKWTEEFLKQVRHILRLHKRTLEDLLPTIKRAVEEGKRVLVVANRVSQAQNIFLRLSKELEGVHLLHSRFTRRDRVVKEQTILNALQGKGDPEVRVLVATQVVEVSLDISFDTIFTEVAPVDDLLQRFGRVNRYGEHPEGVEVHVATEFDAKRLRMVYDVERLQTTLKTAPYSQTPLTVEEVTRWVYDVYAQGWTEKERQRFAQARDSFRDIIKALRPFHNCWEGEEEFYNLFKRVEILPANLLDLYLQHIERKEYLLANSLLVPITVPTFYKLQKEARVWKHHLERKGYVLVAEVPYDSNLGLLLRSKTNMGSSKII